jgi:hypothetical protein
MRRGVGRLALAVVCVATVQSTARAYFLDEQRRFDVRVRAYSQWSVLAQSADRQGCPDPARCPPQYSAGDLAQIRNFYNPEFDAKLTDFTTWMGETTGLSAIMPDDFRFRFAWWGFYDGLYDSDDWAGSPWNARRRDMKARFSQSDEPGQESFVFDDEFKDPQKIYAKRNRINELYVDWNKGPAFFRIGRQAISWGEADTIALLDVQNPFDLTLGAPGFFQDTDEARIPLWTARGTFKLIDSMGPLSSTFLDTYVVPGVWDTTVPINPIAAGVSPFNPDQADPIFAVFGRQGQPGVPCSPLTDRSCVPTPATGFTAGVPIHPVVVDRLPRNTWENSRWGVRLTGVVARDYTVQTWFFRTFNQAPSPVLQGPGPIARMWLGGLQPTLTDDRGFRVARCGANGLVPGTRRPCGLKAPAVTILERDLESSIGAAATWFSQPLGGVIRTQLSLFLDEIAFIPEKQLNPRSQLPRCSPRLAAAGFPIARRLSCVGQKPTSKAATADYLRFVLGYDRFFFFRPLNPSNSFVLIAAFQGQTNLDAINGPDYRNPNSKPGRPQVRNDRDFDGDGDIDQLDVYVNPKDFEDQYVFEGFAQVALQTDYLHGRLSPRFVGIVDVSGQYAFAPSFSYRFSDNLIGSVAYLGIYSPHRKSGIGTFRAHDLVQFRLTAQLN